MEEETFKWICIFAFPIAVIALLLALTSVQYDFNQTQFIENNSNISINETWLVNYLNDSNITIDLNTNYSSFANYSNYAGDSHLFDGYSSGGFVTWLKSTWNFITGSDVPDYEEDPVWTSNKPNYDNITTANSKYCFANGTNSLGQNCTNSTGYTRSNMSSETTYQNVSENVSGYALNFNGGNYVSIDSPQSSFDLSSAMTISTWVKLDNNIQWQRFIYKGDGGTSSSYVLGQSDSYGIYFGIFSEGSQYYIAGTNPIGTDSWNLVTATWNGTIMNIYLNGELQSENIYFSGSVYSSYGYLTLGASADSADFNLRGSLDEVLIFNRSLSSTEVLNLYNSGLGVYADTSVAPFNSGLVAGYHLDEGSGTNAYDVTGRNNGTLVNSPSYITGKVGHTEITTIEHLGALGLMPYVSATNFISTDYALQWDCDSTTCTLKTPPVAPTQTIFNIGNSTNLWDWLFVKNITSDLINSIVGHFTNLNSENLNVSNKTTSTNLNITNQTDLKNTNINGNLVQTNGNATINTFYAGMHFHNDSGVAIALNSTFQKVNLFKDIEYSNGFTKLGNNTLQMNVDGGVYQVQYELEIYGVQNHEYEAYIFVNETQQMNTYGRTIGQDSSNVELRGFGFIRIVTGQNMTLRVADKTGVTSGNAFVGNINLIRVGN